VAGKQGPMKYHRPHAMGTTRNPRKKQPAGASADPAARVLRRFRIVFNAVKGHFRSVERKAGISGAQVWALSVVQAHPGIGVSELARAMDVHQSTASNLLRTLIDAGLVVSARAGSDRRTVQLQLTPQGQKLLKKAPGPFTGVLPDALQRLDAATLARLDRDLTSLIDALGSKERGAHTPLGSGEP
jgi:DNA-binding MarR family transcriptional regulator